MRSDGKVLYMFALMPDEPLKSVLEAERLEFTDTYNTKKALKNPVHITLIPPFHFDETREHELSELEIASDPFTVRLTGFDSFKRNLVFYIQVEPTVALMTFQKGLASAFSSKFPEVKFRDLHEFNPHLTLGYRDLSKEMFDRAVKDYRNKSFTETWKVNWVYLWKFVNRWQVIHAHPLGLGQQLKNDTQESRH